MTRSQEEERCQISPEEEEKGATEKDKQEGSDRERQTKSATSITKYVRLQRDVNKVVKE